MYKSSSDGKQRSLHHGRYADWVNGEEFQTLEGEFESVRSALRQLEAKLAGSLSMEERRAFGLRKLAMQSRVKELRPLINATKRAGDSVDRHFVQAAKEMLAPGHFNAILAVARQKHDDEQKALEELAMERR